MNRQIKVVHMTTVHHPYDPRIYHKEVKSLHNAGFDVTYIAKASEEGMNKSEVNHIPIKNYRRRWKRMIFGAWEAYQKAKSIHAHIYHFHDPELMPAAWLLKKKNNIVIYDIHEDYYTSIMQKEYLSKPLRKIAAFLYKRMEQFFTKDMELCLAEKYYKDIYPNGVCVLNYPTINNRFLEHNRNNDVREDKVLYTGNVTVDRGALIHARIPQIDKRITVQMVGKCPSSLAQKMYEIAGEEKGRINIEGIDRFVEKEVIEDYYLDHHWLAGIALFPPTDHYMKKELTKFFEYMNAGLPIICSDFPVWKSFVEQHQCGIAVDPYNDEEIKAAIQYLREHPEEAKKMGENGKKAVMEQLNWKTQEEILISWYHDLLKEKGLE